MADVITRFKLETTQYDSKLRDASKGLAEYTRQATMAGNEFGKFTQKNVEAARALGSITPSANNAKDKVMELVGAFNDVARTYNALTKEQQQSDFGKAMAESLGQLSQQLKEAKKDLYDNGEAGKGTSGILDVLKDKFTINIDALTLFNKGLQVAEVALNVAKDAFFASEATVDEWGRIVDSSKSLYEGFLTALNTGDISGYLGRIDEIVQAARTAYNELDRLGTMKTIQGPKMSAQQTENERMRMMIQTGRYIAPVDGRRASMKDGQLLTPEQIRGLETKLQNGMKTVVSLVGNEVKQTGKAIDAVYNRQAKELGLSLKEFRKGTSSMAEFDKRMAGYEQYQKWREQHTTIDLQSGRETVARGNPFEQFAKWGTFRVDGQRYNDLVRLIQQRDQQAGQAYSMQSQAYRTMNRAEGVTVSKLMRGETSGGTTGGRGGGGNKEVSIPTFDDFQKQFAKVDVEKLKPEDVIASQSVWKEYANGIRESFDIGGDDTIQTFDDIKDSMDRLIITSESYKKAQEDIAKEESARITRQKQLKEAQELGAQAAINFGSALASMEDPAAKAAGTVMQAIASIALGFAQASATASELGPFGWVAFLAAGAAAMATTISTVHSLTGYAQGGVIKGNSYSGDNIGGMVDGGAGGFVGLNAGEVVLNAAQQRGVASALNEGGNRRIEVFGRLAGETIYLSSDRYTRRTGRGTIMTWK